MFKSPQKRIFLDYAAGTPVSEGALKAYCDASQYFANPQALHSEGLEAARIVDEARSAIAQVLAVKSTELTFVSGGTEGNNLALGGYLNSLEEQGVNMTDCHVIVSSIEHPSVSDVLIPFVRRGVQVSEVAPNEHGEIRPESVSELVKENTVLVSVALVNSEIGTIQPLHAIGKLLKETKPKVGDVTLEKTLLHTDACQGLYQSLVPQGLGVDLMTLDSGKMYGTRGTGVLYMRRGVKISPVLRGGSQEGGLRGGTENTPLLAGFAAAFGEASRLREEESERIMEIRTTLLAELTKVIPRIVINGDGKNQSPHILNISVPSIEAEYVAMYLDQRGLALSTKSACLERSDASKSHVVAALGKESWHATSALRFSFGRDTSIKDVPIIVSKVYEAIKAYRSFS